MRYIHQYFEKIILTCCTIAHMCVHDHMSVKMFDVKGKSLDPKIIFNFFEILT